MAPVGRLPLIGDQLIGEPGEPLRDHDDGPEVAVADPSLKPSVRGLDDQRREPLVIGAVVVCALRHGPQIEHGGGLPDAGMVRSTFHIPYASRNWPGGECTSSGRIRPLRPPPALARSCRAGEATCRPVSASTDERT